MKKILTVAITFVMVVMVAVSANATTSAELADTLYAKGKKYGMRTADKVKIERYVADNEITEEQANKVVALADEAIAVMDAAGVTSYEDLNEEQKATLRGIANSAADVVGLTLKFSTSKVGVYDNAGKLITEITNDNGKLKYTGNSSAVVVVSSLAIIALVAIIAKKRLSVEG